MLGKRKAGQKNEVGSKKQRRAADGESESDGEASESSYTQIDEDSYNDYKPSADVAKQRSNQSLIDQKDHT